jgi:hypothetical protein
VKRQRYHYRMARRRGESISIGEVLGAIWQMYGAAMEPLQGRSARAGALDTWSR